MASMKGIGQLLVFMGLFIAIDSVGMGDAIGSASAAVGIMAMAIGVTLIRMSKPKA